APVQASLEVVEIVIGHAATRGWVSLRSTHPQAEHAMLSPPSISCVIDPRRRMGWSAAKRGTTRIDGQRRQSRLPSVPPMRRPSIQYSGVVLRSCPPPEYLAAQHRAA